MKRVLNVGGHASGIDMPWQYDTFERVLLDIDATHGPDIVCDARQLTSLEGGAFDAVYCSHNLEHYYRHDVSKVLAGFLHVLKADGFAQIIVPDIEAVMRRTLERGLDIDDVLYESSAGPIMVLDVLYGYSVEIERSGKDFFAHKTGFTPKSLKAALTRAGFARTYIEVDDIAIYAMAFKGTPEPATIALFELSD